ncbi:MAG: (2Fe-2S) ferredoxin domain-containing protein [Cyanobacteria bacterium SID2]|nr:(2Fe-2S) ferredoxin domain-containing protein [Cyanobacteria bacterium SID2]MBP0005005.1 (2Fe-2S) ferredoxin domain-containing protein [Cyanobacteria bacterium SBC]
MSGSQIKTDIRIEGQFLRFDRNEKGQPRRIELLSDNSIDRIKLKKSLRRDCPHLKPGDRVLVIGTKKHDLKTGRVKHKARKILKIQTPEPQGRPTSSKSVASKTAPSKDTGKILICQKGQCRKRGSAEVYEAVRQTLEQQGLADSVRVRLTGCLKRCKSAPNAIVLPNKSHHSHLKPQNIPTLIQQHFPSAPKQQGRVKLAPTTLHS